uniref:Uncharacterized protein n=1 Tax=Schistocephalus solidus TaxID=70667 RepID=A0A0X3NS96_SCHSO
MTLKQEPETAGALAESTKDGPKDVPERPTYAQVRQFVEDVTFLREREGRAATAADDDAEVSPIAVLRASAARLLEDRDQLLEELRKLETSKLRAQKLLASFGRL